MASSDTIQFSKNTTDTLKKLGLSVRGDRNPERAPTVETCDMHNIFREGDKVRVWNSILRKLLLGTDDVQNPVAEGTVIAVTRRLVTVRYDEVRWCEAFVFLDYLGGRVVPVHA